MSLPRLGRSTGSFIQASVASGTDGAARAFAAEPVGSKGTAWLDSAHTPNPAQTSSNAMDNYARTSASIYRARCNLRSSRSQTGPARSGQRGIRALKRAIVWLTERNVIPQEHEERWEGARKMRNVASHPERQGAMAPGTVLRTLTQTAHNINRLFPRAIGGGPARELERS